MRDRDKEWCLFFAFWLALVALLIVFRVVELLWMR